MRGFSVRSCKGSARGPCIAALATATVKVLLNEILVAVLAIESCNGFLGVLCVPLRVQSLEEGSGVGARNRKQRPHFISEANTSVSRRPSFR